MCSIFGPIMENYAGDLTDIVRASTGTSSSSDHWQFSSSDPMINFSSVMEEPIVRGSFGDPFSNMRDPFLHHHHTPQVSDSYFDTTNNSADMLVTTAASRSMQEAAGFGVGSTATSSVWGRKIVEDDMRRPCDNIFSDLIQISPNAKLPVSPCESPATTAIKLPPHTPKDCGLQISSSRNLGLKRRKSLVKKVVCIPAPAAANSRSSGEVVPSDLWAWRKYGQKPIKGSPYPRGYYRCSSSKGCSARKQVERSRTDPNMLVITYTSEHNHPWPTQRNALAGSSRSHTSKINRNSESTHHSQEAMKPKELDLEQKKSNNNDNINLFPVGVGSSASVKQEMEEDMAAERKQLDNEVMDDGDQFFAELGEIEAHYPLNLLFTQGFNDASADQDHEEHTESKVLDPFHDLFDWSSADNPTLFQQPMRGL